MNTQIVLLTSTLLVLDVLGAAGQSALPWVKVDPARRRLMDSTGAERLFHGVNVVSKGAPYLPRTDQFNADDSLVMSTVVLLGVSRSNHVSREVNRVQSCVAERVTWAGY